MEMRGRELETCLEESHLTHIHKGGWLIGAEMRWGWGEGVRNLLGGVSPEHTYTRESLDRGE